VILSAGRIFHWIKICFSNQRLSFYDYCSSVFDFVSEIFERLVGEKNPV